MALWFLVEGLDISAMVRYTEHVDATIARWLNRMGHQSCGLHDLFFVGLQIAVLKMVEGTPAMNGG